MNPMVNITPAPGDEPGWRIHVEYDLTAETQEQAHEVAKTIADQLDTDVTIHGEDGQIREKDSYGNDPKDIPG